jgi:hypothetical protein
MYTLARNATTCAFLLLIALAATAFSQQAGTVSGTVTTSAGAPIANATIELTNVSTNATMRTTTDASGNYRFENVPSGTYRMKASTAQASGTPSEDIVVDASRAKTVNITMQTGAGAPSTTAALITVQDATPIQGLETPQVRTAWSTREIQYLPASNMLERNGEFWGAYNLSLFNAGVAPSYGIGPGRGPVVGGQRPISSYWQVEGLDNNNRADPGPLVSMSNEGVTEFVGYQNHFPPEYGHAAGGQYNQIAKTGANQVHGELFWFTQNRNLNATDSLFARQGNPFAQYDQNRIGGNLGLAVIPNKLFFFGNFEYIPFGAANVPFSPVYGPTAAGYSMLAHLPGVSATNLSVLQQYMPAAQTATATTTVNGVQIPVGPLQFSGKSWQNQYNGIGSVDWRINPSDSLRGRYDINNIDGVSSFGALPTFTNGLTFRSQLANISEYHNLGANGINELRLAFNRFRRLYDTPSGTFPGFTSFPNITIQNLNATLGYGFQGISTAGMNTYQLSDNVNLTYGSHTIRFGYDGRRYVGPLNYLGQGAGAFTYSSLAGFLLNQSPDVFGNSGSGAYAGNNWDHYLYVNDGWRVRPNMNINLGLRWEYVTIPNTLQLQGLNNIASVPGVLTFNSPNTQKTNFAPHVGFAFAPNQMRNFVFRAGFGMNYDAQAASYANLLPSVPPGVSYTRFVNTVTPFFGFFGPGAIVFPVPVNVFQPTVTADQARALTTTYIQDQRLPYTMQWNASAEGAVGRFVLSVGYLGVKGVHLPVLSTLNTSPTVTPSNALPLFYSQPSQAQLNALPNTLAGLQALSGNSLASYGFVNPIYTVAPNGMSWYNGMLVSASTRFTGGLQVKANYTWSHLMDNLGGPNTLGGSLNWINWQTDKGTSIYDHRHVASLTALWDVGGIATHSYSWVREILANMTLSGTFTYASPAPIPLTSGLNSLLGGGFTPSGVFVNSNGAAGVGSGVTPLYNSSGQTVAYLATNPNAQFIAAAPGMYPSSSRALFPDLRPINNFDAAIFKRFAIRDRFALELHGEAYNVLNHAQYVPGSINSIGLGAGHNWNMLMPGSLAFGDVTQVFSNHPRMIQAGIRVTF